jgi:rhodanese-related sulfurtransferase
VSLDELAARLQAPLADRPLLLDVRRADEFAVSRIAGARNVPVGDGFAARVRALGIDTNRPVMLYCSVGYRSSQAAQALQEAGFPDVANLEGSLFAWANSGRPLAGPSGSASHVHPYDREWGELLRPALRAPIAPADHDD